MNMSIFLDNQAISIIIQYFYYIAKRNIAHNNLQ